MAQNPNYGFLYFNGQLFIPFINLPMVLQRYVLHTYFYACFKLMILFVDFVQRISISDAFCNKIARACYVYFNAYQLARKSHSHYVFTILNEMQTIVILSFFFKNRTFPTVLRVT